MPNARYKIQIKHQGTQEKQTILDQVKPTSADYSTLLHVTLIQEVCLLMSHTCSHCSSINAMQAWVVVPVTIQL